MEIQYGDNLNSQNKLQDQSLYQKARLQFIRKVYGIIGFQLLITAAVTAFGILNYSFYQFQRENYWVLILLIIAILTTEILILCTSLGKKSPANLLILGIFTLSESYIVCYICSQVSHQIQNGKEIIFVAGFLTVGIVLSLTAFAIYTKKDFTTQRGIMFVLVMSLILFFFVLGFSNNPILYNLYCLFGIIVFGIYLVIDTQMLFGNHKYQLSTDDYVLGAMLIYIDIIQIFIKLVILLSKASRRN